VTGQQFCKDFNVSWNVFQVVTGYKRGKSSNRLLCPYPNSPSTNRAGAEANHRHEAADTVQTRMRTTRLRIKRFLSCSRHATQAAREQGSDLSPIVGAVFPLRAETPPMDILTVRDRSSCFNKVAEGSASAPQPDNLLWQSRPEHQSVLTTILRLPATAFW
jgi:hypothetical protein